jgi:hypothetical protein
MKQLLNNLYMDQAHVHTKSLMKIVIAIMVTIMVVDIIAIYSNTIGDFIINTVWTISTPLCGEKCVNNKFENYTL